MKPVFLLFICSFLPQILFAATCPKSSQEPARILRTSSGFRLMACGYEEKEKPLRRDRQQMNDFQVYWQKDQEEPKEIFSASAQENFWVSAKKNKLKLEELWSVNGEWMPALSYVASCDRKTCEMDKPICVLKIPRGNFPKVMKDLRSRLQMKDRGPSPEITKLLSQAFALALKGNNEAQTFFIQDPRPSRLDGELGEEWEAAKSKIEKAKKLRCM